MDGRLDWFMDHLESNKGFFFGLDRLDIILTINECYNVSVTKEMFLYQQYNDSGFNTR